MNEQVLLPTPVEEIKKDYPILPPEILYEIFMHLSPWRVAKLESVCKQWRDVSRNNKSLWEVTWRSIGLNPSEIKHAYDRLLAYIERSESKVVFFGLDGRGFEPSTILKLCSLLPQTNVSSIKIFLNADHDAQFMQGYMDSVLQCSNLRFLRMEIMRADYVNFLFRDDFYTKPMAKCCLQSLDLRCFDCRNSGFLFNSAFLDLIANVRSLSLNPALYIQLEQTFMNGIFQIVQRVRDTVETAALPYLSLDPTIEDNEVVLYKMTRLIITNISWTNIFSMPRPYGLECPNLRQLDVIGDISICSFERMLQENIKRLSLICSRLTEYFLNDRFIASFRKCTGLHTLFIGFSIFDWSEKGILEIIKQLNDKLKPLPIEKLILRNFPANCGEEVVNLIKSRLEDTSTTKIQVLHISSIGEISTGTCSWLSEHVKVFKYSFQANFDPHAWLSTEWLSL